MDLVSLLLILVAFKGFLLLLFGIGLVFGLGNIFKLLFVVATVSFYAFVFQAPAIWFYKLIKDRLIPSVVVSAPKIRGGIISFFYDDESL